MATLLARGQITIAAIKDGTDGKPGKDGVSVSVVSTTVEYQISSSATSAPTSGWSTTVKQATDAQPYLWSRTVVKYSDGKSTTTYGVAYKGKNGTDGKNYWQQDVWVDLSAATYDQNTWYTVVGEQLPQNGFAGIKVVVNLNSGTKPSWSTHSAGFSVDFHIDTQASGWGTTLAETIIYSDTFNFCPVSPVSYKQLGCGSRPILYLRGGGKYRVFSTYNAAWKIYKDGYTWQSGQYSQSAKPSSSRPTPEGHTLKGEQGYGIVAAIQREKMYTEEVWAVWAEIGHTESWGVSVEDRNGCRIGDIFTVAGTATDTGNYHIAYYRSTTDNGELVGVCIAHSISPKGDTGNAGFSFANGKSLYKDLLFDEGYNGCEFYNNLNNGNVKLSIVSKSSDNPYSIAKKELKIETTGAATPGHGGVEQTIMSRASAVFVRRVIAKIPKGCYLDCAENAMGTGMVKKWLTSGVGTGTFTEYIYMYQCGASGNFSNGGHMYLVGDATATADKPVVWYIASCETYDMTAGSSAQIKSTEVMYATSTSGTSAPTSGWQKNIPTVASGSFLWSRFTVTYMDGSNAVSYNVSKMGDRGPQGPTGAAGKDAVSASFSPAALTFSAKTEGNGNCLADVSSGNTATITMLEGSSVVTGTYSITTKVGCEADISGNTVKVKSVAYDTIDGRAISRTSASVTVKCEYNGKTCYVSLPISVSVSAVWGGLVTSQETLKSEYTQISNKYNALPLKTDNALTQYTSTIKQSAKEISLKVAQTAVGRKNLLPGSALRRQGEGTDSTLGGNWPVYGNSGIQTIENVDGVNSYSLIFEKYGQYGCIGWHGGSSGNIKVEKGKTYTLSFWAKRNMTDVWCYYEIWYMPSKTAPHGDSNRIKLTSSYLSFSGLNTWELKTVTFSIPQDATMEYIEILLLCTPNSDKTYTNKIQCWYCQPMLVEGDEYVGWSLSEEDAEYIGGNLLDNTDTLVQGGNLTFASGHLYTDANSYKGFPTRQVNMLESTNAFLGVLEWDLSNDGVLAVGQDYMLSFWAKGNIGGKFVACFYKDGNQVVYTEVLDRVGGPNQHQAADGNAEVIFKEDYAWRKYWVHWRVVGSNLPKYVQIRCIKGCDLYVSQPKLEYGATVTEYRATKTDFVEDKSVAGKLLDAGIDINSKEITLTADKTKFRTQTGQEVAVFDGNGLNAKLIRAQQLEAIGLDHSRVLIERGLAQFFGTNGVCNIRVGVDNTGCSVLQFFDSNGLMTYDLGPSGLSKISITKSTLTSSRYYDMLAAGCTSPIGANKVFRSAIAGQAVSAYVASKKNDTVLFGNKGVGTFPITAGQYLVTLYKYTAPTVNGVIQADPDHGLTTKALAEAANGKMFKSKTMVVNGAIANLADGNYIPQNNSSSIKDGKDYFSILWNTEGDYIECPSFCVPGITTINKGLKGFYQTVFSIETKWIYQNDSGLAPIDPPTRPT